MTDFYKNPSIIALKKLIEENKLSDSTLYDFMIGYHKYHEYQKSLDDY